MAVGLLENFENKQDAIASLALVPCLFTDGNCKEMWDESPMDGAAIDDGRLSVPCKRLVAHPTAQELLEGWYCGVSARRFEPVQPKLRVPMHLLGVLLPAG